MRHFAIAPEFKRGKAIPQAGTAADGVPIITTRTNPSRTPPLWILKTEAPLVTQVAIDVI